ncbi:MAG: nuclear transport factor 2 family protein, partial [Chloroflexota bacterium]
DTATMELCDSQPSPVVAPSIEARAMLVLQSLETGDTASVEAYVNPDQYIQHNLGAPDGRDTFLGLIGATSADPETDVLIHRVLVSGNLVAMHTTYNLNMMGGGLTAFDVFRFDDNGQIVEHWDNLQPVQEPNPSGRTAVDGPVAITDLDQTQANCEKVVEFVERSLINPDPDFDITQYINPEMYIQHNPSVADGLEGFGGFMQSMAENNQMMGYTQIHLTIAQGNFVLIASEGLFGDADNPTPTAFYDLFRLEDGLIVEHWDVIAPIPPEEEWQNENGKF